MLPFRNFLVLIYRSADEILQFWSKFPISMVLRSRFIIYHKFQWPIGLGNFICKSFVVETLLWSLEFVIHSKTHARYNRMPANNLYSNVIFRAFFILAACFTKAGRACGMNKNRHNLVNLEQFEEETPKTSCSFKVFGLWN